MPKRRAGSNPVPGTIAQFAARLFRLDLLGENTAIA
jgi:hypothetical protein